MWSLAVALAQEAPDELPELVPPVLVHVPTLSWPEGEAFEPMAVRLLLTIDEEGVVEKSEVVQGEEPFASLALEHAPDLVFEPAVDAGEPIREPGEYEVVLQLSNDIQATVHIVAEVEE